MRLLAQTYLTHRKMGLAEAFYRVIPTLHLRESNLVCRFVHTSFPKNRYKYLKPPQEKKDSSQSEADINIDYEGNDPNPEPYLTNNRSYLIEGPESKGRFVEAESSNDHYSKRPVYLEEMCLAQFQMMYDLRVSTRPPPSVKFENDVSTEKSCHHKLFTLYDEKYIPLPNFVKLVNGKYFQLRKKYAKIIRIHKFNSTLDKHESAYSDLYLFTPWR